MKAALFILAQVGLLLFLTPVSAQPGPEYDGWKKKAEDAYHKKEYRASGEAYARAFVAFGGKGLVNDRYNAACSWALCGETDSAFVQLFKIAQNGNYSNLNHLLSDTDLNSLHADRRWKEVVDLVRVNKEKEEANLDRTLVAILDTVYQEDQGYRKKLQEAAEKSGWESEEVKALWPVIQKKDSINLIKVQKILDERGWLGPDIIGRSGNLTLFLVIQHAPLEVQLKYLPMMREAVKTGKASAANLALLEDRTALGQGRRQLYGSQVGFDQETKENYVLPLEDPDQVDQRRQSVGLPPLADYLRNWNMTWDVEDYKKKLPEIEARQKKQGQ